MPSTKGEAKPAKPSRLKDRSVSKRFNQKMNEEAGLPATTRRYCTGQSFVRDENDEKVIGEDGKPLRKPCEKPPIKGGTVCTTHGGSAKHVKRAADQRLREMVDPALTELQKLVMQNDHLPSKVKAIENVLDRSIGNPVKGATKEGGGSGTPIIKIGVVFGGLGKPAVTAQLTEGEEEAVDADIVDE